MRRGKVTKGNTIPYGTMADAGYELRQAYYYGGYKHDSMFPELPCPPPEYQEYVDPEEELFKKEMVGVVQEALEALAPKAIKVLCLRFGIGLTQDYTLEEVGDALKVSRERIRQIEVQALRDLKHPSRSEKLRELMGWYQTTAEKEAQLQAEWARRDKERLKRIEAREEIRSANLKARGWAEKKLKEAKNNWEEIEPMLADAPWITQLEKAHPEMHQELKYMVGDIWGDHAKQVWDMYKQLRGQT
jgi:hypothetical protein